MKKTAFFFLCVITSVFGTVTAPAQAAMTIRVPHCCAPDSHFNVGAQQFADLLTELSGGQLAGQVFPGSQLGQETEVIQNVQTGVIEATIIGHDPLVQFVPEVSILSLPYLFRDHAQALSLLEGELGRQLSEMIARKGFKVLGFGNNGARVYTNNSRPLNTPSDFRGLKLRSPQTPLNLAVTKAFGGIPVAIPYGEVYTAIQQGTIDGQENAVINIYPARLYEVQKHMAMTNHLLSFTVLLMNNKLFESLPAEQQKIVLEAGRRAIASQTEFAARQADALTKKMEEEGVAVTRPDLEPFRALALTIHEQYVGKSISRELYDMVK